MVEANPKIYNEEHLKALLGLIHSNHISIKEEIANLILILSDEFDRAFTLMEIQRVNQAKLKENEEVQINFNEKPN